MNLKNIYMFLIFTYEAPHGGIQWKLLSEYKKEYKKETKIFTSKGGYQVNLKKKQKYLRFKNKEIKGYTEQSMIQLQHVNKGKLNKCIRLKMGNSMEVIMRIYKRSKSIS